MKADTYHSLEYQSQQAGAPSLEMRQPDGGQEEALLLEALNAGDFPAAEELLAGLDRDALAADRLAILEASVREGLGDRPGMYEAIRRGLTANGRNYELYVMLGNYYLERNLRQAWLCYENALFYCNEPGDREQIGQLIQQLSEEYGVSVPRVAVVVLSYNLLDMTRDCVKSIRQTVPETAREIIVVDNASTDGSAAWLKAQGDIKLRCNRENAGFPRGCNQGIELAEPDSDIFLLNNDTVLPDNALFWLRMGLYEGEDVGSAGSVSNYVSNYQAVAADVSPNLAGYLEYAGRTNVPMEQAYEEKMYLVGFALLLKRTVLNEVGMLDERFSPGNYEDNDIGLRILLAGYRNLLCRNSFIIHWGSRSFRKRGKGFADVLQQNRRKFQEKWKEFSIDFSYYTHVRTDIISMMGNYRMTPGMRILEVGCGAGATLARLKSMLPGIRVYGIEYEASAARLAGCFAEVLCADAESLSAQDLLSLGKTEGYDCIILGDVLEHLRQPEKVLGEVRKALKPGGYIAASLPNVMHYSVMLPLLQRGLFTYTDAGILDRSHLRMYTKAEILRLFRGAGLAVRRISCTTLGAVDKNTERLIDQMAEFMLEKDRVQFLAYQYLLIADVP
ncbi:MAG: methyltransferase domain-containing protein [Blautia sp.]|nr:methyltransferase domain-containing protein [Blautia sp.]